MTASCACRRPLDLSSTDLSVAQAAENLLDPGGLCEALPSALHASRTARISYCEMTI